MSSEAEKSSRRAFPILAQSDQKEYRKIGMPRFVPWDFLEPHAEWAKINHDQTLERLAERGGLGADEMLAIVEHRKWRRMTVEEQYAGLTAALLAYEEKRGAVSNLCCICKKNPMMIPPAEDGTCLEFCSDCWRAPGEEYGVPLSVDMAEWAHREISVPPDDLKRHDLMRFARKARTLETELAVQKGRVAHFISTLPAMTARMAERSRVISELLDLLLGIHDAKDNSELAELTTKMTTNVLKKYGRIP